MSNASTGLNAQDERDAADLAAPWAGYQWKIRELIDRAQAAEANWARSQAEVERLRAVVERQNHNAARLLAERNTYRRRLEAIEAGETEDER